jgi:hypothetical protein
MSDVELSQHQIALLTGAEMLTEEQIGRAARIAQNLLPAGQNDPSLIVAVAQILATNYQARLMYSKVVK